MGQRGDDPCLIFRFSGEKGFAGAGCADVTVSPKPAFCKACPGACVVGPGGVVLCVFCFGVDSGGC